MLVTVYVCSCSSEHGINDVDEEGRKVSLAISLSTSVKDDADKNNLRTTGTPNSSDESKIYRLEVFVFKSDDGKLDGHKIVVAPTEYDEIDEVKGIDITAGVRDVYVIANGPENYFGVITDLTHTQFRNKYEELSNQGQFPYSNGGGGDVDAPIGGITPTDKRTNLTMCGYKRVSCSNQHDQQYLGYTTNGGRPQTISDGSGYVLDNTDAFYVERLVARVAFTKITFDLGNAALPLEPGFPPTSVYEYALDSIFIMNAKTRSYFVSDNTTPLDGSFGHGSRLGYIFLQNKLSNVMASSVLTDFLQEPINSVSYDITTPEANAKYSPLWFYVFENAQSSQYPTYFVISVRYDFISTDGSNKAKTIRYYYPVVINANGAANNADHNYIKRNYQYGIAAVIKAPGLLYDENTIEELRSTPVSSLSSSAIEVEETVGRNLFPWTGSIYK